MAASERRSQGVVCPWVHVLRPLMLSCTVPTEPPGVFYSHAHCRRACPLQPGSRLADKKGGEHTWWSGAAVHGHSQSSPSPPTHGGGTRPLTPCTPPCPAIALDLLETGVWTDELPH